MHRSVADIVLLHDDASKPFPDNAVLNSDPLSFLARLVRLVTEVHAVEGNSVRYQRLDTLVSKGSRRQPGREHVVLVQRILRGDFELLGERFAVGLRRVDGE